MKSKRVEITVKGCTCAGTTTVVEAIITAFKDYPIKIDVDNPDGDLIPKMAKDNLKERLEILSGRGLNLKINEGHLIRESCNEE